MMSCSLNLWIFEKSDLGGGGGHGLDWSGSG